MVNRVTRDQPKGDATMGRTLLLAVADVAHDVAHRMVTSSGQLDPSDHRFGDAWRAMGRQTIHMLPHIVVVLVFVAAGLAIAWLAEVAVTRHAKQAGPVRPATWGHACFLVVALSVVLAAARHVGLQLDVLEKFVLIAFGAVAAGVSLAMGLGGREVASGLLAGYYLRKRFAAGDHVTVAGLEGTVREVGPVSTIVETEENELLHRRSVPNTLLLKEGVR